VSGIAEETKAVLCGLLIVKGDKRGRALRSGTGLRKCFEVNFSGVLLENLGYI